MYLERTFCYTLASILCLFKPYLNKIEFMLLEMLRDMDFRSFIICKKYSFVKNTRGGETSPTTNDGLFKMLVAYFEREGEEGEEKDKR